MHNNEKGLLMNTSRRSFVKNIAAATIAGSAGIIRSQTACSNTILLGICSSPLQAEKLKAAGFQFIEGSVANVLKPGMADAEYAAEIEKLKACALPIRSCNSFIPKTFRLTGPETTHSEALTYAVTACRRADAIGIPYIVLGSGPARSLPEGFDPAKGKEQFIVFCRELGDRIRECKVTVVLEPLPVRSTNLLHKVAEGIDYVDAIDRPRIQLLADIHHMLSEKEDPDSIRKAGARILHCHIAELQGGSAPGTYGEDFRGYFKALKDIGYTGGVSCECAWPKQQLEDAWRKAVSTMRAQMA